MTAKKPSRKWIYLVFGIVIVFGTSVPVPLPLTPLKRVKDMWEVIEALPDGSNAIGGLETASWNIYSMKVIWPAVWHQLLRKHIHVITWAASVDEQRIKDELFTKIYGVADLKDSPLYGKEIVDFGVVGTDVQQGKEVMLEDWTVMIKIDRYGNLLTDYDKLPMMKTFKGLSKADIWFSRINDIPLDRYLQTKAGKDILVCVADTWGWALHNQYYSAGIIKGMVMGIKEAGQYEILEHYVGDAYTYLLVEMLTGVLIIGGLLIGGASFLYKKYRLQVPSTKSTVGRP